MVKNILFDLDGTLTDPKTGITRSFQYALRHMGVEIADADSLRHFIGPPLRDSFRGCGFNDEQVEEAVRRYREYFAATGIYENNIYVGIAEMLDALRLSDQRLIVATSKPTVYAQTILEHFEIAKYFEFVAGSELDGARSNKAEVIAFALAQTGISDSSEYVMVGDREHDIIGARANGMRSIGVLYGYGDKEELKNAGADMLAESVDDLCKLLGCGLPDIAEYRNR